MISEFTEYARQIIKLTCGFEPNVRVEEPFVGTVQIFLSGTPEERSLIMGREGKNINAFSRLIFIFARRNKYYSYTYVQPKEKEIVSDNKKTLDEAIASIS